MSDKPVPWAPFEPSADDPWEMGKVAHLHRRAGFGATWRELQRDQKDGVTASVERFLKPRAMTAEERQILESLRQGVLDSGDADRLKAWWLYRVLYDPDPLREKLTLFWHSHFATSNHKVRSIALMLQQNELLRRHALGPFAALLIGMVADPAMLVWLDGGGSKKGKPNENFAREFLELFTLSTGHYTEKDIREAARAFTGWTLDGGTAKLQAAGHDAGAKSFLKQKGSWKSADIVRITLEQPACAEFLCRKLYRYFICEARDPEPEFLRPLAAELRSHAYDIGHVVRVILRSRHLYSREVRHQRIKSPVECSAGLLRTLEVPRRDLRILALTLACDRQGQELFHPPNVKGWDGGKTWLNSTTLLERGNWGNDIVWGNPDYGLVPYDPLSWAKNNEISPEKAVDALIDLLLQGDLAVNARALIQAAGRDGTADGLRKAIQMILHCPEYQLA